MAASNALGFAPGNSLFTQNASTATSPYDASAFSGAPADQAIQRDLNVGGAITARGSAVVHDTLTITAKGVDPAGTAPSRFVLFNTGVTGGGLNANRLETFGYFDSTLSSSIQLMEQYFATVVPYAPGPPPVAPVTVGVVKLWASVPYNWGTVSGTGPWSGQTLGTGAPVIVACVGIPAGAVIRFMLVGFTATAPACAAPSAITIQPNVSFTYTAGNNGIFNYEVLTN